jgi:prevent-host-death family protein
LRGETVATVGAYEAKTHLPELLKRVQGGEHITIARHGTPVAVLVPVGDYPRRHSRQAAEALLEFARAHSRGGLSVREMIDEGRRT